MQDRIVLKNDIHAQCADREHERTSVIHILELQSLLEKLLAQVNNGFSLGQGVYGCSRVSKFLPGIQHRKDLLGKPAGEQFLCFECMAYVVGKIEDASTYMPVAGIDPS